MDPQIRLIQLGKWEGDISTALALISPYCIEHTVRVNQGGKLIVKNPSLDFYMCVREGGFILIPECEPNYERSPFEDEELTEEEKLILINAIQYILHEPRIDRTVSTLTCNQS